MGGWSNDNRDDIAWDGHIIAKDPTKSIHLTTKQYVDDNISSSYWDRTGTILSPTNVNDSITITSGNGKIVSTNGGGAANFKDDVAGTGGTIDFGNNTAGIGISRDGTQSGYDYNGAFILKQKTSNPAEIGEFIFIEEAGDWRFALPKSQVGAGTYNPRSMIIAGASKNNADNFSGALWGFDLAMDTSGQGADLGVQNNIQVLNEAWISGAIRASGGIVTDETISGANVITTILNSSGDISGANIYTSGQVSSAGLSTAGTISGANIFASGNVDIVGDLTLSGGDYLVSTATTTEYAFKAGGSPLAGLQFVGVGGNYQFTDTSGNGAVTIKAATGHVGIGDTVDSADILHIQESNDGGDTKVVIRNSAGGGSTDETVTLSFEHSAVGLGGKIESYREGTYLTGATADGGLKFYSTLNNADTLAMTIDSNQNIITTSDLTAYGSISGASLSSSGNISGATLTATNGHTSGGSQSYDTFTISGGIVLAASSAGGGSATKEFFVYPVNNAPSSNSGTGGFSHTPVSSTGAASFTFKVPHDFTSLTSMVAVIIADTSETIQWDTAVNYAAAGEVYTTHTGSQTNATQEVTINEIEELDLSSTVGSLAADDYVGIEVQSDTSSLRFIGLRVRYS